MFIELEKTGKTVEEAYEAALLELGVSADDLNVSYEIVEMPTRKLFRTIPAKVLVKVEVEDRAPAAPAKKEESAPVKKEAVKPAKKEAVAAKAAPKAAPKAAEESAAVAEPSAKVQAAMDYLQGVITCMGVEDFSMSVIEKGEATIIRIEGKQLGALIGRRGETMESLSYLASLVANRIEGDYIKLGLDVAGYRDKREQELAALARRLGERVIKNNRAFAMEPMNPYERRLIHAAIGEMEGVRSESGGEGRERHVVIYATAEGANNYPETESRGRGGSRGGNRGASRSGGRGGSRSGGNRGGAPRGGNRNYGERSERRPSAPKQNLPEREFTPVTASEATPVAPKRTERIDDMMDFGFGKIDI